MKAGTYALAVAMALTAACGRGDGTEWQQIGGLDYSMPDGWTARDQSERDRRIQVWAPQENVAKQSVSIMRTPVALQTAGPPELQGLLEAAQQGLPHARFDNAETFVTARGLAGFRVSGEFVPPGLTVPYRRIHIVVLDGTSLVHVMFTAKDPSADPEALRVVLDSIHRREA